MKKQYILGDSKKESRRTIQFGQDLSEGPKADTGPSNRTFDSELGSDLREVNKEKKSSWKFLNHTKGQNLHSRCGSQTPSWKFRLTQSWLGSNPRECQLPGELLLNLGQRENPKEHTFIITQSVLYLTCFSAVIYTFYRTEI